MAEHTVSARAGAATQSAPEFTPTAQAFDEEVGVLDRLVRAADLALQRGGIKSVSIDAVAGEAGVSRATAFRYLGKRDEMVVAVALSRSRRFTAEATILMGRQVGAFAQLEAAFVYLVRELSNDPIVRELLALRAPDNLGPGTHELAVATLGPAVEVGRAAGEIRSDVSVDQIVDWAVEQLYLGIQQADRSDEAVRHRVRMFLIPALAADHQRPILGDPRSPVETLEAALGEAVQALSALKAELPTSDGL